MTYNELRDQYLERGEKLKTLLTVKTDKFMYEDAEKTYVNIGIYNYLMNGKKPIDKQKFVKKFTNFNEYTKCSEFDKFYEICTRNDKSECIYLKCTRKGKLIKDHETLFNKLDKDIKDTIKSLEDIRISDIKAIKDKNEETLKSMNLPDYITPKSTPNGQFCGYELNMFKYSTFLKETYGVVYFNKNLYLYDDNNNVYYKDTNMIDTHLRDTVEKYDIRNILLKTLHAELLQHMNSMGGYKEYPFNMAIDEIPVLNGVIKIDKSKIVNGYKLEDVIKLQKHDRSHMFTYKLPITYDPSISTEKPYNLLKSWVNNDNDVTKLVQSFSQALLQTQTKHSYKRAYFLQGETNSGKTSFFKMMSKLLLPEYIGNATLQELCSDRFTGGNLENKIINIHDDLTEVNINNLGPFKTFTGDTIAPIENKFERKYTGYITCVFLFSMNYPPMLAERVKRDAAFWNRIEYIKFPNEFPTNPKFYDETYTPEFMSGLFNLILETTLKISLNGELLVRSNIEDVMSYWAVDSNPLSQFLDDYFKPEIKGYNEIHEYSKSGVFELYTKWFELSHADIRRQITTLTKFTSELINYGFVVGEKALPRKEGETKRERVPTYRTKRIIMDLKIREQLNPMSQNKKIEQENVETDTFNNFS